MPGPGAVAGAALERDRARQLGGDERAHDRQARGPVAPSSEKPSGSPTPSSTTVARRRSPSFSSATTTRPGLGLQVELAGKAWSMAFWSSSLSTTDSGVATVAGRNPASPSTVKRTGRSSDDIPSSTMRTSGRTISTKATSSPASRDSVSCTSAMERMRRTDSSMATLASGDSNRRPCSRSSDEIVCRLFFTRWWISRIVASLDSSRRSRRRSSEMSRVSTTAPDTAPWSISGMQRMSTDDVGLALELLGDRRADREGRVDERVVEAELAEAQALGVGVHADAVQRRHAVRRRVLHPAGGIEEDHAVADAGRLLGLGVLGVEREVAGRDHAGEPVEDVDVGALELAGLAAERRRRLAGEHADHLAAAAHRDARAPAPAP